MSDIIKNIKKTYAELNSHTVSSSLLEDLYAEDITFIDPLHEINTITNVKKYFENLYKNVTSIEFIFDKTMCDDESAFLTWTMVFSHPKLNKNQPITVPGTTYIKHENGKVTFHQDFFDSAQMIYSHLPILNKIIAIIKNRLIKG